MCVCVCVCVCVCRKFEYNTGSTYSKKLISIILSLLDIMLLSGNKCIHINRQVTRQYTHQHPSTPIHTHTHTQSYKEHTHTHTQMYALIQTAYNTQLQQTARPTD